MLALAARTSIVLLVLMVCVRVLGKRVTGELRTVDILVVLVAANAVQNAMTKSDGHLLVSLVAAGTLIGLGWLLSTLVHARPGLERPPGGAPVVLVSGGRLLESNLRREGVTEGDLLAAMRQQGLLEVGDVELAVLEVAGSISVVPADDSRKE